MMQVKIEPHLFRDLNEFINKDKAFFDNVSIEVQDQQVIHRDEQEERKQ